MNEAPFSSNFVLFYRGVRIQHTIRTEESDPGVHRQAIATFLDYLMTNGHQATEVGLTDGQERLEVYGYVVNPYTGKDGKSGLVLHCYGNRGKYRLHGGAIYDNRWPELPFVPNTSTIYRSEQPPSREFAIKDKLLVSERFDIVVVKTDQLTKDGHTIYKFVSASPAAGPNAQPAATNGSASAEAPPPAATKEGLCKDIIGYFSNDSMDHQQVVNGALRAWARKSELMECWSDCQAAIRRSILILVNKVASDTDNDALQAAIRSIAKVLPDGYSDQICLELEGRKTEKIGF